MTDIDVVTATIWGEARGEPIEGRIAVACVIRNRLLSGRWGHNYEAVARAPFQFSCWNAGQDANHLAVLDLVNKLNAQGFIDLMTQECRWVSNGVVNHVILDRVNSATHYHESSMNPKPKWVEGARLVATIGHHMFYAGVA